MTSPRPIITTALACVLILLTGCAEKPAALPSSAPTSAPIPSPTSERVVAEPEPRFDLGCGDIAAMVDFAVFPEPITLQDPNAISASQGQFVYAPDYATKFRTYGGLVCSWMNGLPDYFPGAQDRQFPDALLEVTVLPDAREFAESQAFPPRDSSVDECSNGYQNLCSYQKLVGDYWIEITTTGADAQDSIKLTRDIETRVAALGAAETAWVPSPSARVLPASCDTVFDDSTVIAQYFGGIAVEPWFGSSVGHFGMELVNAKLGSWTCTYSRFEPVGPSDANEVSALSVSVSPNAGWAVAPYSQAPGQVDDVTEVALAGLKPTESASTACRSPSGMLFCVLHMSVDGNWISVSVFGGVDASRSVVDVAAAVIDRIR